MKIDDKTITAIEDILGFKLYERQIKVIINGDWSGFIPGERKQGRTTAHMIRLALLKQEIRTDEFVKYADIRPNSWYYQFYKHEFMKLRNKLKQHGLKVADVVTPFGKKL